MASSEPTKTYFVFYSTLFSFAWPEIHPPDAAPPWGEDCAMFIATKLREWDRVAKVDTPFDAEGGWFLSVTVDKERYKLFVHWVPVGEPPVDQWAIQVFSSYGCIGWMFPRPSRHFEDLLQRIASILETTEGISAVRRMNFEKFKKVY